MTIRASTKGKGLRGLCLLLAAVMLLGILVCPTANATSLEEYNENALLFWTNVERERNGLPALLASPELNAVADIRAPELAVNFEHIRPNGQRWTDQMHSAGIYYRDAGENIAALYTPPADIVYQWINSPSHRSNLLSPLYTHAGSGYAEIPGSRYTHYWVQNYTGGVALSGEPTFYVAPTGLSADKSSVSVSVGGEEIIAGVLTPNYATEAVTATSSDPSVVKIKEAQINRITVQGVGNGTATVTLKCGKYTADVTVKVGTGIKPDHPFVDVPDTSNYCDAVVWAYKNGITTGTDATHFNPNGACTRGQVVTYLWRAAGSPEPKGSNPFVDVENSGPCKPYYKAIVWAAEQGITTGTDATHFAPHDTVTRAQFVTFLWRCEGKPATSGSIYGFKDAAQIASPYQTAVAWAVEHKIATGYNDGTFRPNDTCTRWAVALFLYRDLA